MEQKIEKESGKPKPGSLDSVITRLLKRRRESIQKSLIRPLYQEALKSMFFVLVLLLDSLIPLQLYFLFVYPYDIIVSLIVLVFFLYIETRVYNSLWGKKGRWSLDNYQQQSEMNKK